MKSRFIVAVLVTMISGASLGEGRTYRQIQTELAQVNDRMAVSYLKSAISPDSDLHGRVLELPKGLTELRLIIGNRAAAESASAIDPGLKKKASEKKAANPLYRDADKDKQGSNWLARAYEKLFEAIGRLLRGRDPSLPNMGPPPSLVGPWAVYLVWGVLGLMLVGFLYLAIRHFSWKAKLTKRATLMSDEEPNRSLDEWLALADEHERNGKFREAVRCLYLACLLKYDEFQVARFDRGQTNWEHLERILKSPRRPGTLDFTEPTQAFDRIWYGHRTEGKADVDRFRAWYSETIAGLGREK